MLTECPPLRALLLTTIDWVRREQQRTIEYQIEENCVLKEILVGSYSAEVMRRSRAPVAVSAVG